MHTRVAVSMEVNQKNSTEKFRGGIIFSFEFHRKRIVAIFKLQKAFSKAK
jgi:hypothetical protein